MTWNKKPKVEENTSIDSLLQEKWAIDPVEMETPNYDYGASQEPLNASFQVRNIKSWWWKYKLLDFTITQTWSLSITWIWFTPKIIYLYASQAVWWNEFWSYWSNGIDINNSKCLFWWSIWWSYVTRLYFGNDIILVRNDSSLTIWLLTSLDNDWFTLNITSYYGSTTYVKAECFW